MILVQVGFSYQTLRFPTEHFSNPHVCAFAARAGRQLEANNDKELYNLLTY